MRCSPRRVAAAVLLAASPVALTGCSATNDQETAEPYQPAEGEVASVGPMQVSSLLVASEGEDEPGNLIARLVNSTREEQTISLAVTAEGYTPLDERFTVPAGSTLAVGPEGDEQVVLEPTGEPPGFVIPMQLSSGGVDVDLRVPVLSGALDIVATLVPTSTPTGEAARVDGDETGSPAESQGAEAGGGDTDEEPLVTSSPTDTPDASQSVEEASEGDGG